MSCLVALVASTGLVRARPPAPPTPVQRAQEYVDRGNAHFDNKRFDQAVAEYTAALAIAPHRDLVWNIARAHEESLNLAEAIALFERYLAMAEAENTAPAAADGESARAKLLAIKALQAARAKGQVIIITDAGAVVAVGGAPVGTGPEARATVPPGRYRIRVTLEGREPVEQVVIVAAGSEVTVELRPKEIPIPTPEQPPVPTDWAGRFWVLPVTPGPVTENLAQGEVELDASRRGRLTRPSERPIEAWRAQHCKSAPGATIRWTAVYEVSMDAQAGEAGTLVVANGSPEGCTCDPFCRFPARFEIPVVALPGFEGIVGDSVVLLRANGQPPAGGHRVVLASDLAGTWEPLLWAGAPSPGARLILGPDGHGELSLEHQGEILSWQRRGCEGAGSWSQALSYPTEVTIEGSQVRLTFGNGRSVSCSCPGACGAAPVLKRVDLWAPAITGYLTAFKALWRRVP